MNTIFFAIVLIAFLVAGFRQLTWTPPAPGTGGDGASQGPMQDLGTAMIDAAAGSVTLALGLVGVMALFLGLMKVAEEGGLLVIIARTVRPLMVRLFPDVPADHPQDYLMSAFGYERTFWGMSFNVRLPPESGHR